MSTRDAQLDFDEPREPRGLVETSLNLLEVVQILHPSHGFTRAHHVREANDGCPGHAIGDDARRYPRVQKSSTSSIRGSDEAALRRGHRHSDELAVDEKWPSDAHWHGHVAYVVLATRPQHLAIIEILVRQIVQFAEEIARFADDQATNAHAAFQISHGFLQLMERDGFVLHEVHHFLVGQSIGAKLQFRKDLVVKEFSYRLKEFH